MSFEDGIPSELSAFFSRDSGSVEDLNPDSRPCVGTYMYAYACWWVRRLGYMFEMSPCPAGRWDFKETERDIETRRGKREEFAFSCSWRDCALVPGWGLQGG